MRYQLLDILAYRLCASFSSIVPERVIGVKRKLVGSVPHRETPCALEMHDVSPDKVIKELKALARELFTFNLLLHGPSALFYAYSLGSCRYIEYTLAFSLFKGKGRVLDVGCGRSLFPSFLARCGFDIVCVDIDRDALMWQRAHGVEAVLADATLLPFRDNPLIEIMHSNTLFPP